MNPVDDLDDEGLTDRIVGGNESGHRCVLINHNQLCLLRDYCDRGYGDIRRLFKRNFACVKLLEHRPQLWSCNSLSRMYYKIGPDGLLYTSKEVDLLVESSNGWCHRQTPNIMGPSDVVIGGPNSVHLPWLSNACCAMRHYMGVSNTTRSVGEIHQKMVLQSYYEFCDHPNHRLPYPAQYPMVCMVNWDNPEDAITIKGSSIQRDLFMGDSYEMIMVKFTYDNLPPIWATYDSRGPPRYGTILGGVSGVVALDIDIHNYSYAGEVEWGVIDDVSPDGAIVDLMWMGNSREEDDKEFYNAPFDPHQNDWRIMGK